MQSATCGGKVTLLITLNTPSPMWNMVEAASCYADACQSWWEGGWSLNTGQSWKKTCRRLPRTWDWRFAFEQDNDWKHTAKDTMDWFRPKNIHVLKWPKSRSKSYWPSVARLENCCSQTLSIESAWAWAVLQRRMSKNFSLWMCKAGRDIPQRRVEEGGSAKYWCRGLESKTW